MGLQIPLAFNLPWCQKLLNAPDVEVLEVPNAESPIRGPGISNSLFRRTLYQPHAIHAQVSFIRKTSEADAAEPFEICYLFSLGDGVDGKTGRAHGGFNALILDHLTGHVASRTTETQAPATATMTIDYKAPIDTPGVILCRGWVISKSGRKTWVRAVIEDGAGKTLATGKSLFITARNGQL